MTGTETGADGLTATAAAALIADGALSPIEYVQACLDRIAEVDGPIQAWTQLDPDYALRQARMIDEFRQAGGPAGPLQGIPVGVKDIIDTMDLPTECGTPILAGRACAEDAAAVAQLREAGAVIMGKTVTTEFAVFHPGKTANPHDATRTPGGSSSGSAAAVAAGMVPAALGSQTNGSTIRPASYCGVCGFKPTHGLISRHGVLTLSPPLDTIGVFARTVQDIALVAENLTHYDPRDAAMRRLAGRRFSAVVAQDPPLAPTFAFVKSPVWTEADDDVRSGFAEFVAFLGGQCDEIALPSAFDAAVELHRTLMLPDMAKHLAGHYARDKDRLSATLRGMIEEGQTVLAVDYNTALDWIGVLNAGLDEIFGRYDAIITPAAAGEAPPIATTGSPSFCTLWTLCGTPAISLPLLQGSNGLPIGVQLVGPRGDDARLLRTARWLMDRVAEND